MHTHPSDEAVAIYNRFKDLPGSEHIGKPVSIDALMSMCREMRPRRILEMGGGIGALSHTLLSHSNAFVDIYEDNEFCRGELRKNLAEFRGRFQIMDTYRMLPPEREYDIAVIDGGMGNPGDGGHPLAAQLFLEYVDSVKAVYIEGYRGLQRDSVRRALQKKYICAFRPHKDVYVDGKKWAGGLEVRCFPAQSAAMRWMSFLFWEGVIWARKHYFRGRAMLKNFYGHSKNH